MNRHNDLEFSGWRFLLVRWNDRLGQHEPLSLWLWNGITKLFGCVDPQLDSFLGVLQRQFLSISVSHAAR